MHPATLCVHPARRNLVLTERMPTKYVPTKWLLSHLAGSTASAIALSMEAAAETRAILSG